MVPAASATTLQSPLYHQLDPHNLQALASAATYQNSHVPLATYGEALGHARNDGSVGTSSSTVHAVIDPSLDDGGSAGKQPVPDGVEQHTRSQLEREDEMTEARIAQVLKAAERPEGPS